MRQVIPHRCDSTTEKLETLYPYLEKPPHMEEPYGERVGGKLKEKCLQNPTHPQGKRHFKVQIHPPKKKSKITLCFFHPRGVKTELGKNLKTCILEALKDESGTKLGF